MKRNTFYMVKNNNFTNPQYTKDSFYDFQWPCAYSTVQEEDSMCSLTGHELRITH